MTIFVQLLEIIILKRRPSDINFDTTALGVVFLASIFSGYFQLVASNTFAQPLPFMAAQAICQGVIVWLLLKIKGNQNRFVQTATALFGVAAMLQFIGLIAIQAPALMIFGVIVTAWNFYMMVLILSEGLDCSILQSVLITIAYHFVIGLILLTLFPDLYAQMQAALESAGAAK